MVAGNNSRTMRGPGRLVANPSTAFATTAFPYGGVEIGQSKDCALASAGTPFRIESEALGRATDILEPDYNFAFACEMRGWDDDAVELLLAGGFSTGATTQHAVFSVPGNLPGTSTIARAVVLAYVPDDPLSVNALLIYRGIPNLSEGQETVWQRSAELSMILTVECLDDDNGNLLKIGRLADLALV